ncbi:GPP34 family phosphoprotein [Actinomadura sp. ATCC 31491]|uniref:GPP34 family phosphoprotein n=1 Tax=Actinomadura luzonensis TaxID=2805427 RepID=A0ABT0FPV0_9ACTN|nr:GPP34 family phosphoprotein [Actinomadura luzonensis]MCK2214388.1 GPP34 family phosphoprotein [Actinomadura luzonensis]
MKVTIAEELLLLAYSEDEGKPLVGAVQLDPALAGALLAELAVEGRVELSDKKLVLSGAEPLGDDELDAVLARVAEDGKERKPAWWVQRLQSAKLRNRLLTRLAQAGVLSEQRGKVLGLFPVTRWPEADPGVEAEVRERVASVLGGADPDARTAVLIAIMHAAKLDRKAFPGASKERIKEIAEGAWAADAVAKTIAAINAAAMAAITAATVAATTTSSSG